MERKPFFVVGAVAAVVLAGMAVTELGLLGPGGIGLAGPDETRDEQAETVLEDAVAAASTVDSYRFAGTVDLESGSERVSVAANGSVDVAASRLRGTAGERDGSERFATYILNRTRYSECRQPAVSWASDEFELRESWWRATPMGRTLWLFESGDLHHNGTTALAGRETIVLTGSRSGAAANAVGTREDPGALDLAASREATVRRTDATVWIDAESMLPVRSVTEFVIAADGQTVTTEVEWRFDDYGEEVAISLPAEAAEEPWSGGCPGT